MAHKTRPGNGWTPTRTGSRIPSSATGRRSRRGETFTGDLSKSASVKRDDEASFPIFTLLLPHSRKSSTCSIHSQKSSLAERFDLEFSRDMLLLKAIETLAFMKFALLAIFAEKITTFL